MSIGKTNMNVSIFTQICFFTCKKMKNMKKYYKIHVFYDFVHILSMFRCIQNKHIYNECTYTYSGNEGFH